MTGVSAEWINENYTSLKVAVQQVGTYSISYSTVNESRGNCSFVPKLTVPADSVSATIITSLNPDCYYDLLIEVALSLPRNVASERVGIGEHISFWHTCLSYCNIERIIDCDYAISLSMNIMFISVHIIHSLIIFTFVNA